MRALAGFGVSALIGIVALGCANGGTPEVDPGTTTTTHDAGHADAKNEIVIDSGDTIVEAAAADVAASGDDSSASGGDDSGSMMAVDSGANGSSCDNPETCETAVSAGGSISGDESSATRTVTGITSEWVSIRVTENDSSTFGQPMNFHATLKSPPTAIFDLFVYLNKDSDVLECETPAAQGASGGPNNSASVQWGETGTFANDADDSRTVTIEVRYSSGTCDPSDSWTLTLSGN